MSRCVRKLEGDNKWIVYCNTTDRVFPWLFQSEEAADYFVKIYDDGSLNVERMPESPWIASKDDIYSALDWVRT